METVERLFGIRSAAWEPVAPHNLDTASIGTAAYTDAQTETLRGRKGERTSRTAV